jgi:XapX domain-containing protein
MGLLLGFLIGAGCRFFNVPVPSPPTLVGALLVVAITVGYVAADKLMAGKFQALGTSVATVEK